MKKLLLVVLISIPSFVLSQVVTYDSMGNAYYPVIDTIRIPYPVAKQITIDLISGDSAKAVLELTKEQLNLTNNKVYLKDLTIDMYVKKGVMYEERIKNEQTKFDTQKIYVGQLEKKNKSLKVKLLFTKITLSAVIGALGYLYIIK